VNPQSSPYRIPFNKPCLQGNELEYMTQAIANGHVSGDGPFTKRCHALLEAETRASRALLTTSCTHALEMAALLLDIRPGDEVIVPSFTFVSTVNAFVLRGARPIFADIRPDTLNIDETQIPGLITGRSRAIVVVHYAGVGCEMDAILNAAAASAIPVVEDNAHGLFGRYRGTNLGTFGRLATLSFHETKNISCGEGGALLVNDPALVSRAEILREKGTNRSRFFRGEVDKYGWVDVGSSYLPSDLLAAFLLAQLEDRDRIQRTRHAVWAQYEAGLKDWARSQGVHLPFVPSHCEHPSHLFYLLAPSLAFRTALIAHLKAEGILSVFHYLPLHLSEQGRRLGGYDGQCPVSEYVSDRLLRLPLYNDMTLADAEVVIDAVCCFQGVAHQQPG
jgi:dTDP-4-amino-4,6-dideoxygalactose transaminase